MIRENDFIDKLMIECVRDFTDKFAALCEYQENCDKCIMNYDKTHCYYFLIQNVFLKNGGYEWVEIRENKEMK